jgi:hypothetical protein
MSAPTAHDVRYWHCRGRSEAFLTGSCAVPLWAPQWAQNAFCAGFDEFMREAQVTAV